MTLLEQLVRRWHRRWTAAAGVATVATAVLAAIVAARALDLQPVLPALLAAALVLVVARWRRPRVDAVVLARHLNRTLPAAEESAELLAVSLDALSPLERLQRARVEARLGQLSELPALPARALKAAVWYGAAVSLVAALGLWWNPVRAGIPRPGTTSSSPGAVAGGPPRIISVD
ncbi:MAG TPA: hypothetical protein VKB63_11950, partial [Gemmatimonadales bacterium]|nr:hypothetical protein [Gemmatimonadales bacterium]